MNYYTDEEVDCVVDPTNEVCDTITEDPAPLSVEDVEGAISLDENGEPVVINDEDGQPINDEELIETTDETIVEEAEPATWPMYVSLGALGLVVVVFIVLNLLGGKSKK